jgi:hypothetical protein
LFEDARYRAVGSRRPPGLAKANRGFQRAAQVHPRKG